LEDEYSQLCLSKINNIVCQLRHYDINSSGAAKNFYHEIINNRLQLPKKRTVKLANGAFTFAML